VLLSNKHEHLTANQVESMLLTGYCLGDFKWPWCGRIVYIVEWRKVSLHFTVTFRDSMVY